MDASTLRRYNDRLVVRLVSEGWRLDDRVPLMCECENPVCLEAIEVSLSEHAARAGTRWLYFAPGHADGPMRMLDHNERFVTVEPMRSSPLQPLLSKLDHDTVTTAVFDTSTSWSLGALVESNGPLLGVLGSMRGAAIVWDAELRVVYLNDAATATRVLPADEALGCTPAELDAEQDAIERFEAALRSAIDTGHIVRVDSWSRAELGHAGPASFDITIQPIVDSDGTVIGACSIATEAMAADRTRAALRASGRIARDLLGAPASGALPDLLDRVALELVPEIVDGVAISLALDRGPARLAVMRHRDEEVEALTWRRDVALQGLPAHRVQRVIDTGVSDVALVIQPARAFQREAEEELGVELTRKANVVSRAALPIRLASSVVGVLAVMTDGTSGRSLTHIEVDLLEEVASFVGEAILARHIAADLAATTWFEPGKATNG